MTEGDDKAMVSDASTGLPGPQAPDLEQLQRSYGLLMKRVTDLEEKLTDARRETSEARWSVRLLRDATANLLAPIMLVGSTYFLLGWMTAENSWDYALIAGAAIFGVCWLRNAGRRFDEV
ncbi:hypothetical protein GGC65_000855 [Sphingopyxis sp. OAS728]|uniref:hypothetical protein n=1 Tax=Sphingopyxis sp. OAS728 TaxID=2663823 RepID=UPI00178955BE|nr:hypothetical protein [Sphingopyxis sp. OAS728]MBE1526399.1 hypothetical protein [Sphingopyxis sp. OAS728]